MQIFCDKKREREFFQKLVISISSRLLRWSEHGVMVRHEGLEGARGLVLRESRLDPAKDTNVFLRKIVVKKLDMYVCM